MSTPLTHYWTSSNGDRAATRFIVFHHAAWMYALGQAIKSIYDYHRSKWPTYNACGYHLIAQQDADGRITVYQVNPHGMQGAGVANRNHECYHVCAATNFTALPSEDWLDASAQALAEAKRRYPNAIIVGHKEIALKGYETACPGPRWAEWKSQLLARVDRLLAPTPAPTDWPKLWGDIATPRGDQWGWASVRCWQAHAVRLGPCRSHLLYDPEGHAIMQCFEHGVIRSLGTSNIWEACYL